PPPLSAWHPTCGEIPWPLHEVPRCEASVAGKDSRDRTSEGARCAMASSESWESSESSANRRERNAARRAAMVEDQLRARGIRDERVLEAMGTVPRGAFVPVGLEEFAYDDAPLPIGHGQTISQPYVVALMIEALELRPNDRVLDVGTGSGYAAAIASRIALDVFTIERIEPLAREA